MEVSWGKPEIDNTIGKIRGKTITLFFGPTGSGKTTLCSYWPLLRIYVEAKKAGILNNNHRFIIIDGDGGFDIERFKDILRNNGVKWDEVKKYIIYYDITEFDEQHKLITQEIPKEIKEKKIIPLMISVDPMTAIYRGIILRTDMKHRASTIGNYTGKLDLQLVVLRRLSVEYDCPIFISTWPASKVGKALGNEPPELPFIGGRQMGFIPKTIVEIQVPNRYSPLRKLILFKSRGLPAGIECEFKLTNRGIE